jgi:hypothetical protein
MELNFRKQIKSTNLDLLKPLLEMNIKSVDVINATSKFLEVSMKLMSKKEIKNFTDGGFKIVDKGNKRKTLVFNGK